MHVIFLGYLLILNKRAMYSNNNPVTIRTMSVGKNLEKNNTAPIVIKTKLSATSIN